jgi:hypothetical protein
MTKRREEKRRDNKMRENYRKRETYNIRSIYYYDMTLLNKKGIHLIFLLYEKFY